MHFSVIGMGKYSSKWHFPLFCLLPKLTGGAQWITSTRLSGLNNIFKFYPKVCATLYLKINGKLVNLINLRTSNGSIIFNNFFIFKPVKLDFEPIRSILGVQKILNSNFSRCNSERPLWWYRALLKLSQIGENKQWYEKVQICGSLYISELNCTSFNHISAAILQLSQS